jgi:hypothetical protein
MEIIWGRFVEKTGGQKSRATVPLMRLFYENKMETSASNSLQRFTCKTLQRV